MSVKPDRREFLTRSAALAAGALAGLGGLDAVAAARPPIARVRPRIKASARTLAAAIRGPVFTPSSRGYAAAARIYNELFDGVRPQAVARPVDARDLQAAVRWCIGHDVRLRSRSGGHSYAGYSTTSDGVVLDLRSVRGVSVDRRAGTANVGAGAQLIDVLAGLAGHGATLPTGSCPSVGIAGVTLGGGMGLAGRAFGLTGDNLVGARIVTADGRLQTVDRRHNPDLLWALRGGGGGNFGVVSDFTFRIHPLPARAGYFFVSWPWSSASAALAAWQAWAPRAREELTSIFHLEGAAGTVAAKVSGQYLGPAGDLQRLLSPLRGVPGTRITIGQQDYLGLQLRFAGCLHTGIPQCHTAGAAPGGTLERASFRAKSDYVTRPLSSAGRSVLIAAAQRRAALPGSGALLFDSYGGALNRPAPDATAFVHRDALFCIQYLTYGGGSDWLRATHQTMRPYVSGQAYQNYIDSELTHWQQAYYGQNLRRLEAIRRDVDPQHRFNFPQAIGR